jgi:hypothetical protein
MKSAIAVRQPSGTAHIQLRPNQEDEGCGFCI